MFKIAITALFLMSFFHNSFAFAKSIPKSGEPEDASNVSQKKTAGVKRSIEDKSSKLDEWTTPILQRCFTDLYFGNGSKYDISALLLDKLTKDLVAMADPIKPSHFILPLLNNTHEEDEHRAISKIVIQMYMDLRTMGETHLALIKAVENVIEETTMKYGDISKGDVKATAKDFLNLLSEPLFKGIDDAMKNNKDLSDMYQKKKTEAHSQIISEPKITGPLLVSFDGPILSDEEIRKDFFDRSLFRKILVNSLFMIDAFTNSSYFSSGSDPVLARCIIQWSKNETENDEASKMYTDVLSSVSSKCNSSEDFDKPNEIIKMIHQEMKSKIETKPSMLASINTCQIKMKEELQKKNK